MKKFVSILIMFGLCFLGFFLVSNKYCSSTSVVEKYITSIEKLSNYYHEKGNFPMLFDAGSVCISYSIDDNISEAFIWLNFPLSGELGLKLPKKSVVIGNDSAGVGFRNFIFNINNEKLRKLLSKQQE